MPVSHAEQDTVAMPKKKTVVINSKNQRTEKYLTEPLALSIMQEMNITPVEEIPYSDECTIETSIVSTKSSKRTAPEEWKNKVFCTPTGGSPSFKAFRDDFVLFKKIFPADNNGEDLFKKLSDEIILHIFTWLPKSALVKCSRVCKRWRNLSYDETLWKRYDFGKKLIKPGVLGILLSRGTSVLRLAMSEIKSPVFSDDINISLHNRTCCNLQYLDLSMVTISEDCLSKILFLCKKLKKLSLENCQLNEECCRNITSNTELTVLNMAMCRGLTAKGLYKICISCRNLREWNLSWTNLTSLTIDAISCVMPLHLRRLNISGHRNGLTNQALVNMCQRCRFLVELDISDSTLIKDCALESIVASCPKLEHLHTSRSFLIAPSTYKLLKKLEKFRNLEIFRTLPDDALAQLRSFLPDVKINQHIFSTIARPTTGIRRTSIWGLRVRD